MRIHLYLHYDKTSLFQQIYENLLNIIIQLKIFTEKLKSSLKSFHFAINLKSKIVKDYSRIIIFTQKRFNPNDGDESNIELILGNSKTGISEIP